jgi:hypothetical protein
MADTPDEPPAGDYNPVGGEPPEIPVPQYFRWCSPTTPFSIGFFVLGMCILAYGLVSSLTNMNEGPLLLAAIGSLIGSLATPGSMSGVIGKAAGGGEIDEDYWNVRPFPPMNHEDWHLDRLTWDEDSGDWLSNPLARFEQDGPKVVVTKEGEEWVVNIEGKDPERVATAAEADKLMREEIKDADSDNTQELLFSEHPRHARFRAMYNATPPMISSKFLWQAISVLLVFSMWWGTPKEPRGELIPVMIGIIVIGFILIVVTHFLNRSALEAWDTVSSIVKFLDAGHNELVGQVRPADFEPLEVFTVDNYRNKSWAFNDLVAWSWSYSVHLRIKETYIDNEGKRQTRYVYRWRTIRSDSDARKFLLHDGSGGVVVDLISFEDISWGSVLWSRNQPGSKPGNPPYRAGRNEKVMEHSWVLHGLKIGDPVYVMARIKNRTDGDELRGMVSENASRLHHNLVAVGEDAPRRHAMISKGTELGVLKARSSGIDRFGGATLLIMTTLIVMVMSL